MVTAALMSIPAISFFSNSSKVIIFLFFVAQCFVTLSYCFFIASIFFVAKLATLIGLLMYSAPYFLQFLFPLETSSKSSLIFSSLFPANAISYGVQAIAASEANGMGVSQTTLEVINNVSGFSIRSVTASLCFQLTATFTLCAMKLVVV